MLSTVGTQRRKMSRAFIKIPVACEIINPIDQSSHTKNVIARDLNTEGIFFGSDEIFPLNSQIHITFQLPLQKNIINASIKVIRVEVDEEGKKFYIGALFTQLNEKDKLDIGQLLERVNINKILELAIEKHASDLHLTAGSPPIIRVFGELEVLNLPMLGASDITLMLYSLMGRQHIKEFELTKETDFGIQYDLNNRFRVNVHQQRGFLEATLRWINANISSFEDLKLPDVVKDLTRNKDGLILITGPAGSGKTTTVAAMVELINQERNAVIIIIERAIEYLHANGKSIVKQREVGVDTNSFSAAIKSSLRQDPNVIVVGELGDIETIKTVLYASEAGYMVIASCPAPNITQALDMLANVFPVENRKQILSQLATCLKGVIYQCLLPLKDKKGRVLATEVMVANEAVQKVIRNDELIQIPSVIQTGATYKMHSLSDSIRRLSQQGLIEVHAAIF
jgi:twitching motility protein PilT